MAKLWALYTRRAMRRHAAVYIESRTLYADSSQRARAHCTAVPRKPQDLQVMRHSSSRMHTRPAKLGHSQDHCKARAVNSQNTPSRACFGSRRHPTSFHMLQTNSFAQYDMKTNVTQDSATENRLRCDGCILQRARQAEGGHWSGERRVDRRHGRAHVCILHQIADVQHRQHVWRGAWRQRHGRVVELLHHQLVLRQLLRRGGHCRLRLHRRGCTLCRCCHL